MVQTIYKQTNAYFFLVIKLSTVLKHFLEKRAQQYTPARWGVAGKETVDDNAREA